MPRYLGVDLGTRRIGIAVSDPKGVVATPYATLQRTSDGQDAQAVVEMMRAEGAKEVVLGYPLTLNGERGDAALVTEAFAEKLREVGAKVRLWDERMSTAEAGKKLTKRGMSARKQRAVIDKAAATVILQSFLDSRKRS